MALWELTHVLADIAGLIGITSFKDKQDEALRAFLNGQYLLQFTAVVSRKHARFITGTSITHVCKKHYHTAITCNHSVHQHTVQRSI